MASTLALLTVTSAALSATLIGLLRPLLQRYALVRPNARSSHIVPTAQGAGIAVVVAWAAILATSQIATVAPVPGLLLGAVGALALTGLADDLHPLPVLPRLCVQATASVLIVLTLPSDARVLPLMPVGLERVLEAVGLVWFINLTNFMDGIDGMTVAGLVPAVAGATLILHQSWLCAAAGASLVGSLIGFAPFNRHVARVFLGDVGSLAIGGIAGWLLLQVACSGAPIAALILPLYYLTDTGLTLLQRWHRGARLTEAHRDHYYQRALSRGLTVPQITHTVWLANGVLIVLALVAAWSTAALVQMGALALALAVVAVAVRRLERP